MKYFEEITKRFFLWVAVTRMVLNPFNNVEFTIEKKSEASSD